MCDHLAPMEKTILRLKLWTLLISNLWYCISFRYCIHVCISNWFFQYNNHFIAILCNYFLIPIMKYELQYEFKKHKSINFLLYSYMNGLYCNTYFWILVNEHKTVQSHVIWHFKTIDFIHLILILELLFLVLLY